MKPGELPGRGLETLGLVLTIGLMASYVVGLHNRDTTGFYLLAGGYFVVWALLAVPAGAVSGRAVAAGGPFFALVGWMLVSAVWSIDPGHTAVSAVSVFIFAWLTYLLIKAAPAGRQEVFYWLAVVLTIVTAVLVYQVQQRYGSVRVANLAQADEVGTFSNKAGAVLVGALPFLLYGARSRRGLARLAAVALVVVNVVAIYYSESRAAYLLAVVSVALMFVLSARDVQRVVARVIGTAVALALLGPLVLYLAGADAQRTFQRITESRIFGGASDPGGVDSQRVDMFHAGWVALGDHPVLGTGYDTLQQYMAENSGLGVPLPSHSLLVTASAELGLVGILLLVALVVAMWSRFRGGLRTRTASSRVFVAASVTAGVVVIAHGIFRPQWDNPMFYVALAAVFALGSGDPADHQQVATAQRRVGRLGGVLARRAGMSAAC